MADFQIVKIVHTSKKFRDESAQITYKAGDYKDAPVRTKHVRRSSPSSQWRDKDGNTYA